MANYYMLNIITTKNWVMSRANNNIGRMNYLFWLLISLGIVVILSFVLPFPISFVVSLLVIFCLNIIRAEMTLRKAGMGGIKGLFKSFSSSGFGRGFGTGINSSLYQPLRFSCMNCGNEHNKIACPKCGSKAVRPV
jgi:hypothetical protein